VRRGFHIPASGAPAERAFLVGVQLPGRSRESEEENLDELELLAKTAGAEVVGRTVQSRTRIDGSTFIGEGKLESIARQVIDRGINLIIFDDDLSPAQARNIERRLEVNVIDRTELILDIFARRARTRQARIQVEIAQLRYALPRLRRLWEHLSRQAGGIGTRGPGETQLEVDRRRVRERIAKLKKELTTIDRRVVERRKQRRTLFNVAIVGYTNAGKSTLLNRLAGSRVLQSSRLFSTLDSTTRRIENHGMRPFLLTDTIGFIRKLPPHLIESFRATLRDVREAHLLLHLVDISHPRYEEQAEVVGRVLEDVLGGEAAERADTILVLNKIDLLEVETSRRSLEAAHAEAVLISAETGEGVSLLLERIESFVERGMVRVTVEVDVEDGRAVAAVERLGEIRERHVEGTIMRFELEVRRGDISMLESLGTVVVKPL
jgi:GTP-binding protein HflX